MKQAAMAGSRPGTTLLTLCCVVMTASLAGCRSAADDHAGSRHTPVAAFAQPASSDVPRDPTVPLPVVYHLEIYLISVPQGAFSANEEFWKRINEQVVDVSTAARLYYSGIRTGVAPLGELEHFSKYLDETAPVKKLTLTGMEIKNAEIEMKPDVRQQKIFYLDRQFTQVGRDYEQSANVMNVSFERASRRPGHLRLALCPMVRALRKRWQLTQMNEQYEVAYVSPEVFYDLNFRVDIPGDSFLVVSPSPKASLSTSLGNAFLMKETATDRLEQVLIIIPQPYPLVPRGPAAREAPRDK
jgi:hypothetical protein